MVIRQSADAPGRRKRIWRCTTQPQRRSQRGIALARTRSTHIHRRTGLEDLCQPGIRYPARQWISGTPRSPGQAAATDRSGRAGAPHFLLRQAGRRTHRVPHRNRRPTLVAKGTCPRGHVPWRRRTPGAHTARLSTGFRVARSGMAACIRRTSGRREIVKCCTGMAAVHSSDRKRADRRPHRWQPRN